MCSTCTYANTNLLTYTITVHVHVQCRCINPQHTCAGLQFLVHVCICMSVCSLRLALSLCNKLSKKDTNSFNLISTSSLNLVISLSAIKSEILVMKSKPKVYFFWLYHRKFLMYMYQCFHCSCTCAVHVQVYMFPVLPVHVLYMCICVLCIDCTCMYTCNFKYYCIYSR